MHPELEPGTCTWQGGTSTFTVAPGGEGTFDFRSVTVGLVLHEQPKHWTRYGNVRKRELPLRAGHGWLFPGGIDGWCAWTNPQHFLNVSIDDAVLKSVGLHANADFRPVFGEIDPLVSHMALALHRAAEAPRLYRETLVHALAAHIAQTTFEPAGGRHAPVDYRLRRAADYLEYHMADDVSLEDLAEVAAMSPYHFSRSFKAAFGQPPHAYVLSRRLDRARMLLKTTRGTVAEIARTVGYRDVSRFSAHFKRAMGVSPAAARDC